MNEQRRDQPRHDQQHDHEREAPDARQHDKQKGSESAADRARHGEKPKTEQASHQGGGTIRTDHLPQGK